MSQLLYHELCVALVDPSPFFGSGFRVLRTHPPSPRSRSLGGSGFLLLWLWGRIKATWRILAYPPTIPRIWPLGGSDREPDLATRRIRREEPSSFMNILATSRVHKSNIFVPPCLCQWSHMEHPSSHETILAGCHNSSMRSEMKSYLSLVLVTFHEVPKRAGERNIQST